MLHLKPAVTFSLRPQAPRIESGEADFEHLCLSACKPHPASSTYDPEFQPLVIKKDMALGKTICTDFKRMLGHRMDSPEYFYASGLIHALLGSFEEAETFYKQAIDAKPAYWEAHYSLGVLYAEKGWRSRAIAELKCALDGKPDSMRICRELTHLLRSQGNHDLAITTFRTVLAAVQNSPHRFILQHGLGCACYSAGKYSDASIAFQKALEQKPMDPNLHINLGTSFLAEGKLNEAADEFEAALRIKPDLASALKKLGTLQMKTSRKATHKESSRK